MRWRWLHFWQPGWTAPRGRDSLAAAPAPPALSCFPVGGDIEDFQCPCCWKLLMNPVVTPCRHAFCQPCLQRWTEGMGKGSCPYCRALLPPELPPVSRPLQRSIQRRFPQEAAERIRAANPRQHQARNADLEALLVRAGLRRGAAAAGRPKLQAAALAGHA